MSIKSQKSLLDECSEIIEKSYSARSSLESLSGHEDESEEEGLSRELMHKLTPAVLSKLRRCFQKTRIKVRDMDRKLEEAMAIAAASEGIEFSVNEPDTEQPLTIDKKGFIAAFERIFGNHKYTPHAERLYQSLDPFRTGLVRWRQLISALVADGGRRIRSRAEIWRPLEPLLPQALPHCLRETIVKLISIERSDSFCYAAVTKGGRVGVYSGLLKLLHTYEIFYHTTGIHRRIKNRWITDAIYLPDVYNLVYSCSDRSLIVYDASTLAHIPVYCITGLPNIPTCLAYSSHCQYSSQSELATGSERGDVVRIRFLQPRVALMHATEPDRINYYFWQELTSAPHTSYMAITTWRRVHSRTIRRLMYVRDGDILLSCSHDSVVSVRAKHVPGKLPDYTFKVQRGVSCFHVVPSLHLLVTGSQDGCVSLWELTQAAPYAALAARGGQRVVDVAVIPDRGLVIAYCANCWLHMWDVYEECLLQLIRIPFPFLGVLGNKAEFGTYCIHPGPLRKSPPQQPPSLLDVARKLQAMKNPDLQKQKFENDSEYQRFLRDDIVLTCSNYVCTVPLSVDPLPPASPPTDTLCARTPSCWNIAEDILNAPKSPLQSRRPSQVNISTTKKLSESSSTIPKSNIGLNVMCDTLNIDTKNPSDIEYTPSNIATKSFNTQALRAAMRPIPNFLSPNVRVVEPVEDLDELLEKAGLQGILEKNFVLMRGLKHDLNQKLAAARSQREQMRIAVSAGAPYLAIDTRGASPAPVEVNEHMDAYRRVMKLFPDTNLVGTPTGSEMSTARRNRKTSKS